MKNAPQILREILSERSATNPRYSLRAFARDLDISPQQLSNVMNGQRGFSLEAANKVINKLNLLPHQRILFIESLKAKFSKSKTQRTMAKAKLKSFQTSIQTKNLELDLFKTISNWYHFSLIELIRISKKAQLTINAFSKKLDIPETEITLALKRLERLNLISKESSYWVVNQDIVIADAGISTEAVKSFHKQIIEKSIQAMSFQTSEERYGSSSTLPIKVKDLERAKKLIKDFRLAFDQEMTDAEDADEIYGLSIQFFRLTK